MLFNVPAYVPPLSILLDDIGNPTPEALAAALEVNPSTVRRWMRTDKAPRSVLLALYWLTRWGRGAIDADLVDTAQLHRGMTRALKDEIEQLKERLAVLMKVGQFGSANDALFLPPHLIPMDWSAKG